MFFVLFWMELEAEEIFLKVRTGTAAVIALNCTGPASSSAVNPFSIRLFVLFLLNPPGMAQ